MADDPESQWIDTATRAFSVAGVEILLAPLGVPGLAAGTSAVVDHIITAKRTRGVQHLEFVADHVGEDRLLGVVQSDDEKGEMLWSSTQVSMATSWEGKRIYLARVVANAMTSTEPIDEAQLIVNALKELDGPQIRALTLIRNAAGEHQHDPDHYDDIMRELLRAQRYPILAALARTGVVRQGSDERRTGLFSVTYADTLGICGISDFGWKLLADLESVTAQI